MGEAGTLLSPRVLCAADGMVGNAARPVELVMDEPLPSELRQGQVYQLKCQLANNTDRELKLQVSPQILEFTHDEVDCDLSTESSVRRRFNSTWRRCRACT
jgi:hypothetical protein